jgi:REP element-mobilizing transposase RayT
MPQSLAFNYSHIVFSTKNRFPFIDENIETPLFQYIAAICNNMGAQCIRVGGFRDHIHLLCVLSRTVPLSKFIEEIKVHSSKWIKTQGKAYGNFYWQRGYYSFSINPSQVEIVKKYIENQQEHHRKKTFQKECVAFFNKYQVPFDERYVWD